MNKIFWKVYFVFISIIVFFWPAIKLSTDPSIYDYVDLVFSFFNILGLFGFAFDKSLINKRFWSKWFVISVCWMIIYNFILSLWLNVAQIGIPKPLISYIIGLLLLLPSIIGLYFYGYKSNGIWHKK